MLRSSVQGLRGHHENHRHVDVDAISEHAAVCDILMKNQPTPLLRAARARGLVAEPGFDMLVQQTPLYLDFFGYPELAASVRSDDAYLLDLLIPASMRPLEGAWAICAPA